MRRRNYKSLDLWSFMRRHGNGRIQAAWKVLGTELGFSIQLGAHSWRWTRWEDAP